MRNRLFFGLITSFLSFSGFQATGNMNRFDQYVIEELNGEIQPGYINSSLTKYIAVVKKKHHQEVAAHDLAEAVKEKDEEIEQLKEDIRSEKSRTSFLKRFSKNTPLSDLKHDLALAKEARKHLIRRRREALKKRDHLAVDVIDARSGAIPNHLPGGIPKNNSHEIQEIKQQLNTLDGRYEKKMSQLEQELNKVGQNLEEKRNSFKSEEFEEAQIKLGQYFEEKQKRILQQYETEEKELHQKLEELSASNVPIRGEEHLRRTLKQEFCKMLSLEDSSHRSDCFMQNFASGATCGNKVLSNQALNVAKQMQAIRKKTGAQGKGHSSDSDDEGDEEEDQIPGGAQSQGSAAKTPGSPTLHDSITTTRGSTYTQTNVLKDLKLDKDTTPDVFKEVQFAQHSALEHGLRGDKKALDDYLKLNHAIRNFRKNPPNSFDQTLWQKHDQEHFHKLAGEADSVRLDLLDRHQLVDLGIETSEALEHGSTTSAPHLSEGQAQKKIQDLNHAIKHREALLDLDEDPDRKAPLSEQKAHQEKALTSTFEALTADLGLALQGDQKARSRFVSLYKIYKDRKNIPHEGDLAKIKEPFVKALIEMAKSPGHKIPDHLSDQMIQVMNDLNPSEYSIHPLKDQVKTLKENFTKLQKSGNESLEAMKNKSEALQKLSGPNWFSQANASFLVEDLASTIAKLETSHFLPTALQKKEISEKKKALLEKLNTIPKNLSTLASPSEIERAEKTIESFKLIMGQSSNLSGDPDLVLGQVKVQRALSDLHTLKVIKTFENQRSVNHIDALYKEAIQELESVAKGHADSIVRLDQLMKAISKAGTFTPQTVISTNFSKKIMEVYHTNFNRLPEGLKNELRTRIDRKVIDENIVKTAEALKQAKEKFKDLEGHVKDHLNGKHGDDVKLIYETFLKTVRDASSLPLDENQLKELNSYGEEVVKLSKQYDDEKLNTSKITGGHTLREQFKSHIPQLRFVNLNPGFTPQELKDLYDATKVSYIAEDSSLHPNHPSAKLFDWKGQSFKSVESVWRSELCSRVNVSSDTFQTCLDRLNQDPEKKLNWERDKSLILYLGLMARSQADEQFKEDLLNSSDHNLKVLGSDPNWMITSDSNQGKNHYGKVLMLVRDQLRDSMARKIKDPVDVMVTLERLNY